MMEKSIQKEGRPLARKASVELVEGTVSMHSSLSPFPAGVRVQAKLETTVPGDALEQEADATADRVLRKIEAGVQGGEVPKPSGYTRPSVSAYGGSSVTLPSRMESRLSSSLGGGQSMPGALQSQMEGAFGQSFSNVRLHTDPSAAEMSGSIGAKAFTYGNDIYFNQGRFQPDSSEGRHLIAHELAHTVQQTGKVAREEEKGPVPESARNIRVTDQEKDEKLLRENLANKLDGYVVRSKTIKAPPSKPPVLDKEMIENLPPRKLEIYNRWMGAYLEYLREKPESFIKDVILPDCIALIEVARNADAATKQQLVQQLYNTLSQISVALDILPKPEPEGNKVDSLRNTLWITCRNKFNEAVKELAQLARNPAIAVLMYEGTYYPGKFNKITTAATDKMVDGNDFSDLLFYGAVCNNAAYGSVRASGATYQKKDNSGSIKPFKGLSSESREKWNTYNLQGDGYGKNALDGANQGDIVVFWNLSEDYSKASLLDKYVEWCREHGHSVPGTGAKLVDLQEKIQKQKKDSEKKIAEKEYKEAKKPVWKSLMDEAEKTGGAVFDDLIKAKNVDASHIEVIVGVDEENHKYLTSGAHGSKLVNGFVRTDGGNLAWKNAEDIRNKRIMRRIPLYSKSDAPLIAVNIPSIMQNQQYDTVVKDKEATDALFVAMHEERLKREHSSASGAVSELIKDKTLKKEYDALVAESESRYKKGEYSHIDVYYIRNESPSVTVDWVGTPPPPQKMEGPDPQLVGTGTSQDVPFSVWGRDHRTFFLEQF